MNKKIYKSVITNIKLLYHNLSLIEKVSLISIENICYKPLPTYCEFINSFNKIVKKIICVLQHFKCTKKLICHLIKMHNNFIVALAVFSNYTVKEPVITVQIINPCDGEIEDYDVNYAEYLELIGCGSPLNLNLYNKIKRYKYILYAIKKKAYALYKNYLVKKQILKKYEIYKIENDNSDDDILYECTPPKKCKPKYDCGNSCCDDDCCNDSCSETDFCSDFGSLCKTPKNGCCNVTHDVDLSTCTTETDCCDDDCLSVSSCHMTV